MNRRLVTLTVLVAVAVTAFTLLGLWQLDRLQERRAEVMQIRQRLAATPIPFTGAEEPYRRVFTTGHYERSSVLLRNRSYEGQNGAHVLVPFVTAGGVVLVDRGWIPRGATVPDPPNGTVNLEGVVRLSQTPSRVGPKDPPTGKLEAVYWVDLNRLGEVFGEELGDRYLEVRREEPSVDPTPIPPEDPPLDEGPHLSYAIQWFAFAGIALAGYVALLRQKLRRRALPR